MAEYYGAPPEGRPYRPDPDFDLLSECDACGARRGWCSELGACVECEATRCPDCGCHVQADETGLCLGCREQRYLEHREECSGCVECLGVRRE